MFPNITSKKLHYRQLVADDWRFFLSLQQDERVMRYVADPQPEDEIRRDRFEIRLPRWQKGSAHWLCLVIIEKGHSAPLGLTGLIDRGAGIAEVGFLLAAEAQGKGLGSESLHDIARYALNELGFRKLIATVTAGNEASRRTLLKVGFQQEGTLRKSYHLAGEWRDDWVFGLFADEWKPL